MLLCFAFFGVVRAEVGILQNAVGDCRRPTDFTASTIGAHSVVLSWTENGPAPEWEIAYMSENDTEMNYINFTTNPYTLTGLTPETMYAAQVTPVCEMVKPSEIISWTTDVACPAPTNLTATQVTATSATLNWEGFGESYNVSYAPVVHGKVIGSIALDDIVIEDPDGIQWVNLTGESGNSVEITGLEAETEYMWRVQANCGAEDGTSLWSSSTFTTLDACATPSNLEVTDFTATSATLNWTGAQDSYNVQYRTAARAGEWVVVENVNTAFNLTPLEPETEYEWQVQGVDCDGEGTDTEWSEIALFTTDPFDKQFVGGDNNYWNVATNWDPEGIPTEEEVVLITVPVEIPDECVALANKAYLDANATVTIKDGGQLKYNGSGLIVTMEKNIAGYDESHTNNNSNNGGYYLLANPVIDDQAIADITGMTEGSYDLYKFESEWINQKDENQFTSLSNSVGYLYANANDRVLSFTGEANATTEGIEVPLDYNSDAMYAGVNLIGNPFTCNAYFENEKDFYIISEDHDPAEFVVSVDPIIKPMQGVLVVVEEEEYIMFSPEPTEPGDGGRSIDMHLNNREGRSIDLARVRFGQGSGLRKFQLNPSHTKVFIPQDGTDFAVAFTDSDSGEMPVCFKAQDNGQYTFNVTTKGLELNYLHLIDNAANKDIDLLDTPSYSFEASSTDNADRFRLVFVCGEATGDNFAFFSNGSFVINNEGEAVLQVIDVMGRIVKSETINGCTSVGMNAVSGIYMLRLVNGDNVKVQKVVVR